MPSQRYQHAVGRLWEDEEKIKLWARLSAVYVEKTAIYFGCRPPSSLIEDMQSPDCSAIRLIEEKTGHDFESFLLSFEDGSSRTRWLHFGLTSSDIIDSVLHLLVAHSAERLLSEMEGFISSLAGISETSADVSMIGRTHGRHASNTKLSSLFKNHLSEFIRISTQLKASAASVRVGKLSGPMGDSDFVPKSVEREVLSCFGLTADTNPTQMICRDRISSVLSCVESLSAAIRRFAINLRLLCSDDCGVIKIERPDEYVGSSSMPHKNNPTELERLCGMSVELIGLCRVCKDTYAESWLQRDISNSCVERDCLPKVFVLSCWSMASLTSILRMLSFSPQEMATDPYHAACLVLSHNDMSRVAAKRLVLEQFNAFHLQPRYEPTEETEEQ